MSRLRIETGTFLIQDRSLITLSSFPSHTIFLQHTTALWWKGNMACKPC